MKNKEAPLLIHAYLQDPLVATEEPIFGFQEIEIKDYFNLLDGPTSSRFAVVDYNGTTGTLLPPVKWDAKKKQFKTGNIVLNNQTTHTDSFQFHQLNVWAIAQNTLHFFESAQLMGRKLPWGFDGNRLIIVPHAGYGQNAYYDRESKSLQFYYFNNPDNQRPVYTCLSADIINHELAHAILDGIRPHFTESTQAQTAGFHEFFGDLTAILTLLRNNEFRKNMSKKVGAHLESAEVLSNIADEFGRAVEHKPYLRSAQNSHTMEDVADSIEPHDVSEVMTGAMFDLILALSKQYIKRSVKFKEEDHVDLDDAADGAAIKAFWYTIYRMQRMAMQPLDFLPPVDVTFRDYAVAMLRAEQLSNPTDPNGYRKIMFNVFKKRGILAAEEEAELLETNYLFDRNNPRLFFYNSNILEATRSRAAAYDFLNNNRKSLGIPLLRDFIVADLYECNKQTRQGDKLPRQIVLCYLWHEEVLLTGSQFGEYEGKYIAMPCGGTLVFDDLNNVLHWANKPGTEVPGKFAAIGEQRKQAFLVYFARQLQDGAVGEAAAFSGAGFIEQSSPPVHIRQEGNLLRLKTTPHLHLNDDHAQHSKTSWQISF